MKMKKKMSLLAGVLASSMVLSPMTAVAEPNRADVNVIVELALLRDFVGLAEYIEANLDVLEGNTTIAQVLRSFWRDVQQFGVSEVVESNLSLQFDIVQAGALY